MSFLNLRSSRCRCKEIKVRASSNTAGDERENIKLIQLVCLKSERGCSYFFLPAGGTLLQSIMSLDRRIDGWMDGGGEQSDVLRV